MSFSSHKWYFKKRNQEKTKKYSKKQRRKRKKCKKAHLQSNRPSICFFLSFMVLSRLINILMDYRLVVSGMMFTFRCQATASGVKVKRWSLHFHLTLTAFIFFVSISVIVWSPKSSWFAPFFYKEWKIVACTQYTMPTDRHSFFELTSVCNKVPNVEHSEDRTQ